MSTSGREEESLALRCPSKASPRRGWKEPVRPNEGILDPVAGLWELVAVLPALLELCSADEMLGSKSASDGIPD